MTMLTARFKYFPQKPMEAASRKLEQGTDVEKESDCAARELQRLALYPSWVQADNLFIFYLTHAQTEPVTDH